MNRRLGTRGRGFAVAALVAFLAAAAGVVLISLDYQRSIGNSGLGDWTLRGVIVVGVAFGVPLLLALSACLTSGRTAMVLRWLSAGFFGLLVLFFAFGGGIYFIPAAGLMAAAAILSSGGTAEANGGPDTG